MQLPQPIDVIGDMLSLKEIAALLVRHNALHDGLFDVSIEMQFAIGNFGPTQDTALPGAMLGVKGMGLVRAAKLGLHTVDAALVNPAPETPPTDVKRPKVPTPRKTARGVKA